MNIKPKRKLLNLPVILSFDDYHEINYIKDYFNKINAEKIKIKSKELGCTGKYNAIFYYEVDKEYQELVENYKMEQNQYDRQGN